jgi:hypothetical protein
MSIVVRSSREAIRGMLADLKMPGSLGSRGHDPQRYRRRSCGGNPSDQPVAVGADLLCATTGDYKQEGRISLPERPNCGYNSAAQAQR